ncbi:unnamed protein product [Camellia sinensis]
MDQITNVVEYEAIAKEKLPKMIYDYYASGAEDQWTLKENRNAFSRILFRPRILIDVTHIDMTTTVLGFKISMPIMIAPAAMQKMAHHEGEYATARAASAAGTIMLHYPRGLLPVLKRLHPQDLAFVFSSSMCTKTGMLLHSLSEELNEQASRQLPLLWILQGSAVEKLILRIGEAEQMPYFLENQQFEGFGFNLPPHLSLKNFEGLDLGKVDKTNDSGLASYVASQVDQSLSWKDVKWLQTITHLPILVKGVLTAEDARLAVQAGAAGIIVSNHGARQLDYVPATIMALEEVVKAAQGRVPVFLDGGVRRGTDVFKALALGASGIFVIAHICYDKFQIGRPVLFALAADGEAGVRKVLQILHDELELTMALSGCRSLKEITRNHIVTPWDAPLRIAPKL